MPWAPQRRSANVHIVAQPAWPNQGGALGDLAAATCPYSGSNLARPDSSGGSQMWKPQTQGLEPTRVTLKHIMPRHAGKMVCDVNVVWFRGPIRFVAWPIAFSSFCARE